MFRIIKAIDTYLEDTLSVILYTYVVVIIFAEVVARYLLDKSILWSNETAIFAFIWLSYLSMANLAKNRSHLAVTFLRDSLPRSLQLLLLLVSDLLLLILASVVVVCIRQPFADAIDFEQKMVGVDLPFWMALAAVPVGWSLVALRTLQRAWIAICDFRAGRDLTPAITDLT
ncbi:TRAP transporter small permease [Leisingera daeponensis]|uniref:TRAP transporter small permease n=1 Tax=Leisingera daeponensis TaxID=405746 RepID=UPI001C943366|nr:TRAP transporter small permease subunit [Leisingera daeponensis]MBY6059396.1 TRAP transporter small permease subunit [Leisingera daeponensis]